MKTRLISARVPEVAVIEVEQLAKDEQIQKTVLIKEAILLGLQKLKLEHALALYKKGKVTLWKAAELAGLSLWEILETIKAQRVPLKYSIEDAQADLKLVFGE